jgi:hypothetical protein
MNDEQIKQAAKLISDIEQLEKLMDDKATKLVIGRVMDDRYSQLGGYAIPVEELSGIDARELLAPRIYAKRAELEALRFTAS